MGQTLSNKSKPLKIGMLVGSVGIASGGVAEAVRSLSRALSKCPGISVEIFSLANAQAELHEFGSIPVTLEKTVGPASFGYAPRLLDRLRGSDLDVLHVHGLWMYLSIAARQWALATGRPYLVTPHGMLDPWALRNQGAKKRLARFLYEDAHLRNAAHLHALCGAEADAIRAAGITTPVVVLPNGVDPPAGSAGPAPWRRLGGNDARFLLFLGRVTPKKKVTELIDAFVRARRPGDPWHLVIVGPIDNGYRESVEAARAAACRDRIHILGPSYGEARHAAYASADAFVLPSVSEGLPMAVLEAFSYGLPALISPQCNLPEAYADGAALRIGTRTETMVEGLQRLFSMPPDEYRGMAQNARQLAAERFDWARIALQMAALYRQLVRQKEAATFRRSLTARAGLPA